MSEIRIIFKLKPLFLASSTVIFSCWKLEGFPTFSCRRENISSTPGAGDKRPSSGRRPSGVSARDFLLVFPGISPRFFREFPRKNLQTSTPGPKVDF